MDAQTLIDAAYLRHKSSEDPDQLHRNLPTILRTVLELLLDGFDFDSQPKTGTATAARMLSCMIATLEPAPDHVLAARRIIGRTKGIHEQALGTIRRMAFADPYAQELLDEVVAGHLSLQKALDLLDNAWRWEHRGATDR